MKKLWFMLAMVACFLASCSDGGSDEPSTPTPKPEEVKTEITIDSGIVSNGLSFASSQGEQSVSFSVNANWTLNIASTTSGATWCKASVTSGSKGSANVKFTVNENTSYDGRSVSVTIKAGTVSKTFTITQKGAEAMLVTTSKYEVAQDGGTIEVEVKANIDYELAISETAKEWITETKSKSRGLTTYKHSFDVAMNEETEKREGEITFKSGDKVETVKVYQAGGAIILLTKDEYTVSDAGETITVDIKSNVEYGVQMPDVDWITDEASSRGMSSHTLKYVIAPNEGYDSRSAEIIFYDKNSDLKETLKVIQAQKDAIVISKKEYDVKAEGETIEVKLSANVEFEVTMPEADWISQTESRSLKEHTLYFKVAENTSEEDRGAEIVFTNKDSQLSEKITITQKGVSFLQLTKDEFTVSDAGETIEVEIKSNVEYDIQMPEADWITQDVSGRGVTAEALKFIVDANEGYDSRSAEIIFYDKNSNLKDTLKVVQAQKNAIILSQKEYEVKAEGETIEVKLSANVDFEVTMPEVDWVTQVESRALKEHTLYFKVAENTGEESRSGEIVFTNKDSQLSEAIIINQIGAVKASYVDGVVTMAKAGTMRSLLGDDFLKITSLKVVGPINGDDVYYLRMMLGANDFDVASRGKLTTLDLSETIIVEGGEWYYNNCYTSNNMIGDYMFYYCRNLQHISLPKNVTSIGNYAFEYCVSLSSIVISNHIIRIGKDAFNGCPSLSSVYITDLTAWCNIEFLNNSSNPLCEGKLYLNDKVVTDLVVPDNVTVINDYVFHRCSSLESVNIGDHVTSMGRYAFYGCKNLASVTIGNGLTSISDYTFSNCESLTSFVVPDNITSIGEKAFYNCDALTSIIIPDNVTSVGGGAFSDCDALTSITIGNGLTSISGSAFGWCDALTSIIIPDNVTSIGSYAFYACKALNSVTIGNGVISIGESAFAWCEALTSIVIPDNVTSIGSEAFMKCNALTSITIGGSLNEIDDMAFKDCKNLTSIMIPDNVTSLGREAFSNCDALASVKIGDGMTSIGNAAFYDCDALATMTIGDGITTIPDSLCYSCDKLNEVRIGKGIQRIGILAFYIKDGYSIEKFYCYAPLPPKFSNNEKYIGQTSRPNSKPGYLMRIYHDYYPFYYRATNYEVKSDYSTGKILNTKDFKTVIQTLYVPVRCSTVYKESDWKEYFSNIVEI